MNDNPYQGLNPYEEKDALFFFGRDKWREKIKDSLIVSRLMILYGESGVGKSSILQAGVVNYLRFLAKENRKDIEVQVPKIAVVFFKDWEGKKGKNLLENLREKIREDVAEAMGYATTKLDENISKKANDLSIKLELVEELQALVKIIGGESWNGKLFIILDQFEEYFQYHAQKENEEEFLTEFARAVNYPDLDVHFLISIRSDEFYRVEQAFKGKILNRLDNCLELEPLHQESAKEAIKKPIERYNFIQNLKNSRLTVLSGENFSGKSFLIKAGVIPYWEKVNHVSPVLLDSWDDTALKKMIEQIKERIQNFLYENTNKRLLKCKNVKELLEAWKDNVNKQSQNSDSRLLIIFDNFQNYIKNSSYCKNAEFIEQLLQVLNYDDTLPIHLLISINESDKEDCLSDFKEFIDKKCKDNIYSGYFGFSEDSIRPKDPKLEIACIDDGEVFSENIIYALGSLDSEQRILSPYLQLVMTELWKKAKCKDGKPSLSLKLLESVKKLGEKRRDCQIQSEEGKKTLSENEIFQVKQGIQEIIQQYVDTTIKILDKDKEQNTKSKSLNTVSRILYYLSTPSGSKHALSVGDIVQLAKEEVDVFDQLELPELDESKVAKLLNELANQQRRILRPVGTLSKQGENNKRYEIYFDGLMLALQSWRTKYKNQLRRIGLKQSLPTQSLALCRQGQKELAALLARRAYWSYKLIDYPKNLSHVDAALRKILRYPYFSSLLTVPNKLQIKRDFWQVKFSADGTMLAASNHDGSLWVWDVEREGSIPKLIGWKKEAHNQLPDRNLNIAVRFSLSQDNNKMLISSGQDGKLKLWAIPEFKSIKPGELIDLNSSISDSDYDPNKESGFTSISVIRQHCRTLLAAGNWTGNIRLWDISQPQQPKPFPPLQRQFDYSRIFKDWLNSLNDGISTLFSRKNHQKNNLSGDWIWSVDASPDGNLLAAGGRDGIVYPWNIEDPRYPRLIRRLKGHQEEIFCVAFAPDGKLLASASRDCTVHLWKLDQIEVYIQNPLKKVLKGHKGCVRAIAFNSEKSNSASDSETQKKDSTKLASASEDQTIRIWNLNNLEEEPEVLYDHSYSVSSVAFDPNDTQRLVSCSWDRTIRFWTLGTEPKIFKVPEQDVVWDKIIRFLNLRVEAKIFQPRHKEVIAVTWVDETQFALVRSDGFLEVRECDNHTNRNKPPYSVCLENSTVATVAFFGKGKQKKIAVGYSDGSIWIWELNFQDVKNQNHRKTILNGKKMLLEKHPERRINLLAFSSDAKFIAAGLEYDNHKTIKVWDVELEQPTQLDNVLLDKLPNETVNSVVFKPHVSNDELILAIAYKSEKIYLCNLKTGKLLTDPPLEHEKIYGGTPIILAFSPDGKWLVSGSDKQYLLLWDTSQLNSCEPKATPTYPESEPRLNFWVTALAFKDNRWVASGRYDGSIELWDLENLNNVPFVLQGHKEKITAIAFSPDKKQLVSASFDNTVRLWTIETEELANKLKKKLYRCLSGQEKEKYLG